MRGLQTFFFNICGSGGSGVGAQEQEGAEDARLRPRRAYRNAARRRQDPP